MQFAAAHSLGYELPKDFRLSSALLPSLFLAAPQLGPDRHGSFSERWGLAASSDSRVLIAGGEELPA